jgi:hypothetical protein
MGGYGPLQRSRLRGLPAPHKHLPNGRSMLLPFDAHLPQPVRHPGGIFERLYWAREVAW